MNNVKCSIGQEFAANIAKLECTHGMPPTIEVGFPDRSLRTIKPLCLKYLAVELDKLFAQQEIPHEDHM